MSSQHPIQEGFSNLFLLCVEAFLFVFLKGWGFQLLKFFGLLPLFVHLESLYASSPQQGLFEQKLLDFRLSKVHFCFGEV